MLSLLELTNRVLTNVGERVVDTTQNFPRPSVVAKAVNSLSTALVQMIALKDWSWLREERTALWQNATTAVIEGRVTHLYNVYDTNEERRIVMFVKPEDLHWSHCAYTCIRQGTYLFGYEPLDTALVFFDCCIHPIMPEQDDDVLDIPLEHTELLILRASANMALAHNSETDITAYFTGQYEQLGQMLRGKDRTMQNDSINFLGAQRRGYTWY